MVGNKKSEMDRKEIGGMYKSHIPGGTDWLSAFHQGQKVYSEAMQYTVSKQKVELWCSQKEEPKTHLSAHKAPLSVQNSPIVERKKQGCIIK